MTHGDILALWEGTTAEDWVYWVYVPWARPGAVAVSPAAARRGVADGHFARAVCRHDLSLGLAWGVVNGWDLYRPEWDFVFPDPSACLWVDLLCDDCVAERYLAVTVRGGTVSLPAPSIEHGEDGSLRLWVSRRKLAIVRLANEIDPTCSGFDTCFARSGIEVR